MTKIASPSGARPALHKSKRARGSSKQASTQPFAASVSGAFCQFRLKPRLLAEIADRSREIAKVSSMTAQIKSRLKRELKQNSKLLGLQQRKITDLQNELLGFPRFNGWLFDQIACIADKLRYVCIHCCMHMTPVLLQAAARSVLLCCKQAGIMCSLVVSPIADY